MKRMIEKQIVPFIEGKSDGPFYYTLTAVDIHLPIHDELKDVTEIGRCFSIHDDYFRTYLAYIFSEMLDVNLPANWQRYTSWEKPDTKRFDRYAINNFYTKAEMEKIADRVEALGDENLIRLADRIKELVAEGAEFFSLQGM